MAKQAESLFIITRDNVVLAARITGETGVLAWFHSHTSQSKDWMCKHEGYAVESYPDAGLFGRSLECAETHNVFVGAKDGCTTNYAISSNGEVLSDAGVDIRQRRELLDRSKPLYAYVGSDGKTITGWKGNVLMRVTGSHPITLTRRSYTHGKYIQSIVARDVHGNYWYGRGNPGICITLRAYGNVTNAQLRSVDARRMRGFIRDVITYMIPRNGFTDNATLAGDVARAAAHWAFTLYPSLREL